LGGSIGDTPRGFSIDFDNLDFQLRHGFGTMIRHSRLLYRPRIFGELRMTARSFPVISDLVPWDEKITAYDEAHMACYVELLDAAAASRTEDDMCRTILGLDPSPRAIDVLHSHLKRAHWMTAHGYRQLLQ